ncbi:MAG: twin-arginine translocase TatA/TatE family subunit [Blastocatellia bacterium]|nr:twin-arginine translocase TatA/TatE family subunit [Blastocatellia bacterium]
MGGLGFPEILVIGIVLIVLFGAKRIPELATGLGSGIKNFKKAMNEGMEDKDTPEVKEKK